MRIVALIVLTLTGLLGAGAGGAEEVTSRWVTVRNLADTTVVREQALSRSSTARNLPVTFSAFDAATSRLFTPQNVGAPAGSTRTSLARALTLQNLGLENPPIDESLARALTLRNVGLPAEGIEGAVGRAFTTRNLNLGVEEEPSVAGRAFTLSNYPESFAGDPDEALGRPVTLRNFGDISEPETGEVLGRSFTAENVAGIVDVPDQVIANLPAAFALFANAPNPFGSRTRIRFDLPRSSSVDIRVYDVSGRLVRILLHAPKHEPGRFYVEWDGRDQSGTALGSGVYFYRMRADGFENSRRMVLTWE